MNQESYKIIFFGTPEFASSVLRKLSGTEFKPLAVVTAPDKPVGRKRILTPPPVKILAQGLHIPILQTNSLRKPEMTQKIIFLSPDLFVIAAYGLVLPPEILKIPKFGSLNIHPSLLPKYRGASPIQAAILADDKKTGVTIMLMDEEIDHGPILARGKIRIDKETAPVLSQKLAQSGADLLIKILPKWFKGKIKPQPQKHKKASFTRQIRKENGKINWSKPARHIERMSMAYQPWPGIYTFFNGKVLKILEVEVLKIKHKHTPGKVFLTRNKELSVACGKNALILKQVQLESKNPLLGKSFLNGHSQIIGAVL